MGVAAVLTTAAVIGLTPQQKAALVVVSGRPAPAGVGGVIVQRWDRNAPRPAGTLVFVDQEGGDVRAFRELPPAKAARRVRSKAEAYGAGVASGLALRRSGVQVDLAPVLDLPDGPLGARQYRSPLAPYRAAVEADVPCVMVGHGVYPSLGPHRALLEPSSYRLLRPSLGFRGITITDSLSVVHGRAAKWAVGAARAGADLLLFIDPADDRRAIAALLPSSTPT